MAKTPVRSLAKEASGKPKSAKNATPVAPTDAAPAIQVALRVNDT